MGRTLESYFKKYGHRKEFRWPSEFGKGKECARGKNHRRGVDY